MTELGTKTNLMADGTETKRLYVKHFSLADWALIAQLRREWGNWSVADALRMAVRKSAGII